MILFIIRTCVPDAIPASEPESRIKIRFIYWIPAFAGMTLDNVFLIKRVSFNYNKAKFMNQIFHVIRCNKKPPFL